MGRIQTKIDATHRAGIFVVAGLRLALAGTLYSVVPLAIGWTSRARCCLEPRAIYHAHRAMKEDPSLRSGPLSKLVRVAALHRMILHQVRQYPPHAPPPTQIRNSGRAEQGVQVRRRWW